MKWTRTDGLIAACMTPMNQDGSINPGMVARYVDYLVQNGVVHVYVLGTGGECMSLSVAERKQIAEKWVQFGKDKLKTVIVHCGTGNLMESKELAAHAEKIGASAVACVAPPYYKPIGIKGLVEYCSEVAKAAPNTPFVYYHFPGVNGVEVSVTEFLKCAHDKIPNLVGVKFTSPLLGDAAQAAMLFDGKYEIMNGYDNIYLGALAMGLTSSVGAGWTLLGRPGNRMMDAVKSGDLETARREQAKIFAAYEAICGPNPGINQLFSTMKAAATLSGLDLGPPRVPIHTQTADEIKEIKKRMDACGFWQDTQQ